MGHEIVELSSEVEIIKHVDVDVTIDQLADETMLFSSSLEFAWGNGGPITQEVLKQTMALLPNYAALNAKSNTDCPHIIIDTRVHMLMPGMYPAIPGWHLDHTPRNGYISQPNLRLARRNQQNFTLILSTSPEISRTEFITNHEFHVIYDPKRAWGSVNEYIEDHRDSGDLNFSEAIEGEFIRFNGHALHRAVEAKNRGWRYFIRISFMDSPPQNKIRRQVQVYTTDKTGW